MTETAGSRTVDCAMTRGTVVLDDASATAQYVFPQPGFAMIPLVTTVTVGSFDTVSLTCTLSGGSQGSANIDSWRVVATAIGLPATIVPN
jgi:hypothetical protein